MTWDEAKAALLFLAEERVGTSVRQVEAREQATFERSKAALRAEASRGIR